jgi:subtilisin family serine protease
MRSAHQRTLCLLIGFLVLSSLSGEAATRYVASYAKGSTPARASVQAAGGVVVADYPAIGVLIAESANPAFRQALAADPSIEQAAPDQLVQWLPGVRVEPSQLKAVAPPNPIPQSNPLNAALLGYQWNIFITRTNLAWAITWGSPVVKVAVLDTGICAHHIDLAGKVDAAESASFVPPAYDCAPCTGCPPWEDQRYHGTHVAGIISTNNIGTAGVAPEVRLRAVKVLNCHGAGMFSWAIQGLMYAAQTGNDVINMSLGAYFPKNLAGAGPLVAALNKAVNYANSMGVLVVSSAGNSAVNLDNDTNGTSVPCQSGAGVCVGATTNLDLLADYSNHGLSGPQVVAPGGGDPWQAPPAYPFGAYILAPCSRHSVVIPACQTGNLYLLASGTSMAAPHVAGAAALVDSVARGGPGSARSAQLKTKLQQAADDLGRPGADNVYSHGRLNTLRAVQ